MKDSPSPGALEAQDLKSRLIGPFSFCWPMGGCVAIEGESGAGKSLFLRLLADLDPSDGTLRLDGADRSDAPAAAWRRRAPYVPAEPGWWDDHVEAHFAADDRERLAMLAGALGLAADRCTGLVARLSTGERQRLALIRALLLDSPLLLLDEPTGPLDPEATRRVEALLQARVQGGALVILATHAPGQAERLGARRFRMQAGKLEALA